MPAPLLAARTRARIRVILRKSFPSENISSRRWGSLMEWSGSQGGEHDGIVETLGGLVLEVEVKMPAPVRVAPNLREDPILVEATLGWSPSRDVGMERHHWSPNLLCPQLAETQCEVHLELPLAEPQ